MSTTSVCAAHTIIAILGMAVSTVTQAQENDTANTDPEIGRFRMFSPAGDGIMSSIPFLVDTSTGRVWRFFTQCGDDLGAANGCLMLIPSYPQTDDLSVELWEALNEVLRDGPNQDEDVGVPESEQ